VNDIQKIQKYVVDHPDAPYSAAKKDLGLTVTDVTYYKWRKVYRDSKGASVGKTAQAAKATDAVMNGFKPRGPQAAVFQKLTEILPANPSLSFIECVRQHGVKTTSGTFRRYKEAILTGRTLTKTRKNVYMAVFSAPSDSVPPGAKALLRDFVNALNAANRTNMEVVEYVDPKIIEVREKT